MAIELFIDGEKGWMVKAWIGCAWFETEEDAKRFEAMIKGRDKINLDDVNWDC